MEAPTHLAAHAAAAGRWPAAGERLRVRAAGGVPADVVGRALALDGAGRPGGRAAHDPPNAS